MKRIIKCLLVFTILIFTIAIVPFTVMAADDDSTSLTITSGIDTLKDKESTFDTKRTITGKTLQDTVVAIYVYNAKDLEDGLSEGLTEQEAKEQVAEYYETKVGASQMFSQLIELSLGENVIEITIKHPDSDDETSVYFINRKKYEVKEELEKIIVIPGETVKSTEIIK